MEKAKAELEVIEDKIEEIDHLYSHYSPIGSTIKRQERSIDFIERNYLSILASLNAARLQLKSLEMNSASLQLINPPVFPLNTEPSKRKKMVMGAYAGSLFIILTIFMLFDLLELPEGPLRTKKITGAVYGGTPESNFRQRDIRVLSGAGDTYLGKPSRIFPTRQTRAIVNIISTRALREEFSAENWLTLELGLKIPVVSLRT